MSADKCPRIFARQMEDNVYISTIFRNYQLNKRIASTDQLYQAECSKSTMFHKNPLQTHKTIGSQSEKEMYASG